MKYLKIAALFSLINAIFFGAFLAVLYQQNLRLQPTEGSPSTIQNEAAEPASMPDSPTSATTTFLEKNPVQPGEQPAKKAAGLPAPVPASAPAPNRCIITIKGQRYDVTDFRKLHPGGDVFVCGTDMTQAFFGQHDQQVLESSQMTALRVQ